MCDGQQQATNLDVGAEAVALRLQLANAGVERCLPLADKTNRVGLAPSTATISTDPAAPAAPTAKAGHNVLTVAVSEGSEFDQTVGGGCPRCDHNTAAQSHRGRTVSRWLTSASSV